MWGNWEVFELKRIEGYFEIWCENLWVMYWFFKSVGRDRVFG